MLESFRKLFLNQCCDAVSKLFEYFDFFNFSKISSVSLHPSIHTVKKNTFFNRKLFFRPVCHFFLLFLRRGSRGQGGFGRRKCRWAINLDIWGGRRLDGQLVTGNSCTGHRPRRRGLQPTSASTGNYSSPGGALTPAS